jgi:hypothetical protein
MKTWEFFDFRHLLARYYRRLYRKLLATILAGPALYVDPKLNFEEGQDTSGHLPAQRPQSTCLGPPEKATFFGSCSMDSMGYWYRTFTTRTMVSNVSSSGA